MPGFVERQEQVQLALSISDCIEELKSAAYEAPTGLGKSLAALVPAIANALVNGRRTVVATYTNVLGEQYWNKDLPLALSLFDDWERLRPQFLIGRQRYACLASMAELPKSATSDFRAFALLGIESELRANSRKFGRELNELWQKIAAPPVCPGRLCPHYHDCYYYAARRAAEKAHLVITNHSVVLQDALLKRASEGEMSMLGDYDFLIIDEAHDFSQAAINSLEFELSEAKLSLIAALAHKMQSALQIPAMEAAHPETWNRLCDSFREHIGTVQKRLANTALEQGILRATPGELFEHPQVKARAIRGESSAKAIASEVSLETLAFVREVERLLSAWRTEGDLSKAASDDAADSVRNYCTYLREFGAGCATFFEHEDEEESVGVAYVAGGERRATIVRHDVIGLSEPLRELLWNQVPTVSISATLAIDGNFDFFRRITGAAPDFEEILPSPFDFSSQAALYLPKPGRIPDPTVSRKEGTEEDYFDALAAEVAQIIEAVGGKTLALFHSRREMEAVHQRVSLPPELPVYLQKGASVGWVGDKFRSETHASLFALRSFWTGFDAPGETLSCVVLVRIPFEVPVDPAQVARMAWMQTQGLDPFAAYSLPNAKMLVRQGAGRLIRTAEDRGVIALLDPRVRTKRYGEELLDNLPREMRTFDDIFEAIAAVGLEPTLVLES